MAAIFLSSMMTLLGSTAPCRGGTVCNTFRQGSKQVGGCREATLTGFDSNNLHEGMVKSVSHWHGPDRASRALTNPTFDQTCLFQRFQRTSKVIENSAESSSP